MRNRPPQSQRVDAPLTSSATFLTLTLNPSANNSLPTLRSSLAGISGLAKNVTMRDQSANFTVTVGIGACIWDSLLNHKTPRPKELHPFRELRGAKHTAPSTPGDVLVHIRAERRDLCFEFERQLLAQLGDAVAVQDETVGFRYFDNRDLLGFVDGTANPSAAQDIAESVTITSSDDAGAAAVGGSYVVVQKYLHDMEAWKGLSTEQQESIIGRTKLDNVELDDAPEGKQQSHKSLATVEEDGMEYDIVRDNMPFGNPGQKEFGTYFIGYSRRLWVVERMLERMFLGAPEGLHDRILDFSKPVTGAVFFAPTVGTLESLADGA
jgi:porphyrinogen peroxidase